PNVDQLALGIEKVLGTHWKAEIVYTNRVNGDIVGLVDRNAAKNYTAFTGVSVQHRLGFGQILDATAQPLVLPAIDVSNADLLAWLRWLAANPPRGNNVAHVAQFTPKDTATISYRPDVVLGAVPAAIRRYDQLTLSLTAAHPSWT